MGRNLFFGVGESWKGRGVPRFAFPGASALRPGAKSKTRASPGVLGLVLSNPRPGDALSLPALSVGQRGAKGSCFSRLGDGSSGVAAEHPLAGSRAWFGDGLDCALVVPQAQRPKRRLAQPSSGQAKLLSGWSERAKTTREASALCRFVILAFHFGSLSPLRLQRSSERPVISQD